MSKLSSGHTTEFQRQLTEFINGEILLSASEFIDAMGKAYPATYERLSQMFFKYDKAEIADEFWLVSEWLAIELRQYGEAVVIFHGLPIWGRYTDGCESISEDRVIQEIYLEHIA